MKRYKALEQLQPLRIPAGWRIGLNQLQAIEPGNESALAGTAIFSAVHEARRFWIDVTWEPELDPDGEFRLAVYYAPWERTERGRRREAPLHFGADAECVHEFKTRSHEQLVVDLQQWLFECTMWMKEGH